MTTQPIPSTTDDLIAEIEAAAKAATRGPHHIYTHPRDCNNWGANKRWHEIATPQAFEVMANRIRELEDVLRMYSLPIGGDLNRDCAEFGADEVHREIMRRTVLGLPKVTPP